MDEFSNDYSTAFQINPDGALNQYEELKDEDYTSSYILLSKIDMKAQIQTISFLNWSLDTDSFLVEFPLTNTNNLWQIKLPEYTLQHNSEQLMKSIQEELNTNSESELNSQVSNLLLLKRQLHRNSSNTVNNQLILNSTAKS